jgi:formate-dependent nitrite reductase membrane component NrfD
MNELDVARHSRSVDPVLHVWGWEIPVYLFLGGMAAGAMIVSALLSRREETSRAGRLLALAAPVLVSIGMGALFLDLAHKLHVWRFYLAFRWTSPMSWGAWILVVVYPVTLLFALARLTDPDAAWLAGKAGPLGARLTALRTWAIGKLPALRTWMVAVGVGLGVYTGILLSTLGARALWSSALLGPLFLVSGVSTGAAFMMLFPISGDERRQLARWDLWAMGVEGVLLVLFLVGLVSGGAQGGGAAALLLGGKFTAQFWALVVIAGLAVPALLEVLEHRLHLRPSLVAPALVLVGGFSLRWIFVAAGQV